MGVMGGKLRIDPIGHAQQFRGAAQIRHIGCHLAGVDRKGFQPLHLRALDLAIPIGAFDQAHHDFAIKAICQGVKPIQHLGGAFSIGLHHHAKPIPAGQPRVAQHRLDHIQRQIQPVCLFCIDIQPHACIARQQCQL